MATLITITITIIKVIIIIKVVIENLLKVTTNYCLLDFNFQ
jgi:hypothetical protein